MTGNLVVLLLIGVVGVLSVVWTVFDAARDLRRRPSRAQRPERRR
jgi:hypothetical protein